MKEINEQKILKLCVWIQFFHQAISLIPKNSSMQKWSEIHKPVK